MNFICARWEDGSKRHIIGYIGQVLNESMSYDAALRNRNILESDECDEIETVRLIGTAFAKVNKDLGLLTLFLSLTTFNNTRERSAFYHSVFRIYTLVKLYAPGDYFCGGYD